MKPDLYIEIPAWGEPYTSIAAQWTIPAVKAALQQRGGGNATFCIHTKDEDKLDAAIGPEYPVRFFPIRTHALGVGMFIQAHREAILSTPLDSVVVLLNADLIVSGNFFACLDELFADPAIKVVAGTGLRTVIGQDAPPLGAQPRELMQWAWEHRHWLIDEAVWPVRSDFMPNTIFFPERDSVALHSFYLTPIAIRMDRRRLSLWKTVDYGILGSYRDDEVYFVRDLELAYLELSPPEKSQGDKLNVPLTGDWTRLIEPAHVRNFRHKVTITGIPNDRLHPAVVQMLDEING